MTNHEEPIEPNMQLPYGNTSKLAYSYCYTNMLYRACRKSARGFTACCALLCAVKTGSGEYPAADARSICVLFNHTCARAAGSSYENERWACHQSTHTHTHLGLFGGCIS